MPTLVSPVRKSASLVISASSSSHTPSISSQSADSATLGVSLPLLLMSYSKSPATLGFKASYWDAMLPSCRLLQCSLNRAPTVALLMCKSCSSSAHNGPMASHLTRNRNQSHRRSPKVPTTCPGLLTCFTSSLPLSPGPLCSSHIDLALELCT